MNQKTKHLKNAYYTYGQFGGMYPILASRTPAIARQLTMTIPDWMGWSSGHRVESFRSLMLQEFETPAERD